MSTGLIVLVAIGVAAITAIFVVISLRNGIIGAKNRVQRAWADVIAYQRKKLRVIPALEEGLKNHQAYEQGVLQQLTALRSSVAKLSPESVDVGRLQEVDQCSKALLSGLRVAVEAYPVLKTSELYAGWMRELSEAEENIAAAIVIFNGTVESFNDCIQEWPGSAVNARFNREKPLDTFTDSAAQNEFEYKPNFSR
jgi:LemA protein